MSDNTPKTPSKKPVSKALKRVSIASLAEVKGSSPQLLSKGNPQRPQTPDVDRDDVSVAESSKGNRRTEEERRQFFLDQPECREVEPHRAFCTGCNEWVALNPSRPYVMRPWTVHRKDCRRNSISAKPCVLYYETSAHGIHVTSITASPRHLPTKRKMKRAMKTMPDPTYTPRQISRCGKERQNVRPILKQIHERKKSGHTRCSVRRVRSGSSSRRFVDMLSRTGKRTRADALVQCTTMPLWTM